MVLIKSSETIYSGPLPLIFCIETGKVFQIGGTMSDMTWAPQDFIFWMHHAWLDKLWTDWRQNSENSPLVKEIMQKPNGVLLIFVCVQRFDPLQSVLVNALLENPMAMLSDG